MYSKFFNLRTEKQERIINAAVYEFANKGFDNASTNEIVKAAGISKGLLFHYFNNKKDLYLFLYDYFLEVLMEKFNPKIDGDEKDFLKKCRDVTILKLDLIKIYPDMFNFLSNAHFEESVEIKDDLDKREKKMITESFSKLYSNIDYNLFAENIDIESALKIIMWTLEGFSNQQQQKIKGKSLINLNSEEIIPEMDKYLDTLRKTLYR
ncbi:MAG: TetR family transcriptional regulator [Bacillales bacterium]|nr:TetR family transcriptional regulator [Bacillales bacterium]